MRKRLLASFLCLCLLVGLLPTTALAGGTGTEQPTLDISNGSIIITDTGYSQGELVAQNNDLVIPDGTVTEWAGEPHTLTITGTSTSGNMIVVKGGNPEITLSNVSISFESYSGGNRPAILLYGAADGVEESKRVTATIILAGENTLASHNKSPAIQINKNATLTIQGDGTLNASGGGDSSAIGPANDSNANGNAYGYMSNGSIGFDQNLRDGGNLVIKGGTINADSNARKHVGYGSAIGDSRWCKLGSIVIEDGNLTLSNKNISGTGLSADSITIKGGIITDNSHATSANRGIVVRTSFSMSGGSLLTEAAGRKIRNITGEADISITGGNIGNYYDGTEKDGRTRVVMTFYGEDNQLLSEREVEVKEGDGTSWFAYTDKSGKVTTYLAKTENVTAALKGEALKQVTFVGDQGVSGGSCICGTSGVLTVNAAPTSTTVYFDEETLTLSADRSCVLPEGFHGDYEDITYNVVSVTVGETPVEGEPSTYASISGDTLTVNRVEGVTDYTVQVQAEYGQGDSKKTSEPIDIQVSVYQSQAQDGELDIGRGTITVTAGTSENTSKTVYTQDGREVKVAEADEEVTIMGVSDSNQILVESGSPTIRLKKVNLTNASGSPVSVSGNAVATVVLDGENTLTGTADRCAGLEVAANATVTIQVPEDMPDNYGTLTATGSARSAGIGGKFGQDAGIVNIKSGTIDATGGAYVSGIGPGRERTMKEINISGGHITNRSTGNNSLGFESWDDKTAKKVTISGGYLDTNGVCGTDVTISGGTIVTSKNPGLESDNLSITGGNICDSATYSIPDRTRTQLFFYDAQQRKPYANAEVTVTENGGSPWTAQTDSQGMITTYLAQGTTEITAKVGDGTEAEITITNGQGVVGAACTCGPENGTLTMTTDSQSLTAINGEATLSGLAATYEKGDCVLPEHFHGDYEEISYEITKVVKNGQYMVVDQYAEIDGTTLTVYGETNQDPYTVYVRAVSGPEDDKVYSKEVAITVNTYVSEAPTGELDIAEGSVAITSEGYQQGNEPLIQWGENTAHALTITQSAEGQLPYYIHISTNAQITLSNIDLNGSAGSYGAVWIEGNATVDLILQGENTLITEHDGFAALGIASGSTVNIQVPENEPDSYGVLNAKASYGSAGIGAGHNRAAGTINIQSGTIVATGNAKGAGIGGARGSGSVQAINISGGHITNLGSHPLGGGEKKTAQLSISGGTIVSPSGLYNANTFSITGGNIGNSYSDPIAGRKLTKLYFVDGEGKPKAKMEVTVAEGENEWTALTDENGVITTYLASDTNSIKVSYESQSNVSVTIPKSHQALIGGQCTCTDFTKITWETGLPESITLHNLQDETQKPVSMNYDVPDAQLVTDNPCGMPIHPNLPTVTYTLSVTKDGSAVTGDLSQYATFTDGHLVLLPGNAPYTVTLTASVGEDNTQKSVSDSIEVKRGDTTSGEGETTISTINLSLGDAMISYNEDGTYSYTQGESATAQSISGTILITGFADNGTVTVTGGSPTLFINQNDPDDVWTIYDGGAEKITFQPRTLNNKLRFGNADDKQYLLGYVSGKKVKLNPDAGDITLGDGSAAQGAFTVKGLGSRSAVIGGADTEADRLVTNSGTDALSVEINGETVSLTAGGSHTIEQANDSSIKTDGTVASYLLNGTTLLNEFSLEDPKYSYMTAEKFRELIGNAEVVGTVTGYRLAVVGEGSTAGLHGYSENGTLDQQKIAELYLDADLTEIISDTTNAYENDFLFYTNIRSLSIDHAKSVGLYSCFFESIHLGPQVESFASSNYLRGLQEITVDEENEYYKTVDGVLYTKDGSTLILCPTGKTGNYKILDTCTAIADVSFYGSHLSELTFGNQLSSLGSRWMENARFTAVHVPTSNPYFKSEDGVLYSLDGATLLYYPVYKTDSEFSIPEGVTTIANMGIYSQYRLKKLTLPSTLSSVGAYVFRGSPLEELDIKTTTLASASINSSVLSKVTVPDGYNFTNSLLKNTPMAWTQGITVSGGGNISYDGENHSISVLCQNDANVDIRYSLDGETWSETAPSYTAPGTYTIYWRITKPADETCSFARELYSSRTFTITALEADESWFTLSGPVNVNNAGSVTPVTLNQPAAAPDLTGGYTVKYNDNEKKPDTAGSYLVTVDITADGYAKEPLTLGYYTILPAESSDKVLSFVTNGGDPIEPIIETALADISAKVPTKPTRDGYTFAGWYEDVTLRTPATVPGSMPDTDKTYYAKWTRVDYTITYNGIDGATHNNPASYNVETPDFTLEAPVRPGYEFTGWTGSNGETAQKEVSIAKGSTTGDKTYTANWLMSTYNITYPNTYDRVDGNPASYTVGSSDLNITRPAERVGYTFAGWTMVVNGTSYILPVENAAIPAGTLGNITLTGIWLAKNQTITLNANGGKFSDSSETMTITAEFASSLDLSNITPTRSGYKFAGWYTDKECTEHFTSTTMPLEMTIYAKWTYISSGSSGRYAVSAADTENGTVTISHRNAVKGTTVTVTVTPDDGYVLKSLVVADAEGNALQLNDLGKGVYTFKMPEDKVTVTAVFEENTETPTGPFVDVSSDAYYYDAVLWAVEKGITNGTNAAGTTFSPDVEVSRAQMVTFLWRAHGAPKANGANPFTDVSESDYYYDAVLWAVANGVTKGTSATTFSPDMDVTRAQAVTFQWRAAGASEASGSSFDDVAADAWYTDAVTWAVANEITNGTGGNHFSPDVVVSRAQAVTFLYRELA